MGVPRDTMGVPGVAMGVPVGWSWCWGFTKSVLGWSTTYELQHYLADPSRAPDPSRKGHLNSDIGGVTPKSKIHRGSDYAGTSRRKIVKKDIA